MDLEHLGAKRLNGTGLLMLQDVHAMRGGPNAYGLPPDREAEAVLLNPNNWAPGVEQRVPTAIAPVSLTVQVNHGRWIVECPCGSAQLASRTDRRFFCVECGNVMFEGKWVRVEWPADPEAVERELGRRPFAQNRNWLGEDLQALAHETEDGLKRLDAVKNALTRRKP